MATVEDLLYERGSIDLFDYIFAPAYALAIVVLTGIGTFTLYGYSMTDVLASGNGWEITWAWVVAAFALAFAWVTNRAGDQFQDLEQEEQLVTGLAAAVLIGLGFIPSIRDMVIGSDVFGTATLVVLSAAFTVVAYY